MNTADLQIAKGQWAVDVKWLTIDSREESPNGDVYREEGDELITVPSGNGGVLLFVPGIEWEHAYTASDDTDRFVLSTEWTERLKDAWRDSYKR